VLAGRGETASVELRERDGGALLLLGLGVDGLLEAGEVLRLGGRSRILGLALLGLGPLGIRCPSSDVAPGFGHFEISKKKKMELCLDLWLGLN